MIAFAVIRYFCEVFFIIRLTSYVLYLPGGDLGGSRMEICEQTTWALQKIQIQIIDYYKKGNRGIIEWLYFSSTQLALLVIDIVE